MSQQSPDLLRRLQSSNFRDLAGARGTAVIPLSEQLINDLVAASLPASAPVRAVSVHPETDGRFSVRIVPKAALMPALTLKLLIDEQPRLPESAVLVLRLTTLGGLFGLASGAIAGMLPAGITLDGERIRVDLRALAEARGVAGLLQHVSQLRITTDAGRITVHVDALVR